MFYSIIAYCFVVSWYYIILYRAWEGAPRGAIPAQTTQTTSGNPTLGGCRKSMLILGVVLASFWARLGPPWGGLLALGVAFGRPKFVLKPSSKRFVVENVIFHGILRFSIFWMFLDPHGPTKVRKSAPRGVLRPWNVFLAS